MSRTERHLVAMTHRKYNLLKDQIEKEFELILIMEHYDISLAVMVLKLCWDIDEAIYLKVNAQARPKGNAWNQNTLQG